MPAAICVIVIWFVDTDAEKDILALIQFFKLVAVLLELDISIRNSEFISPTISTAENVYVLL